VSIPVKTLPRKAKGMPGKDRTSGMVIVSRSMKVMAMSKHIKVNSTKKIGWIPRRLKVARQKTPVINSTRG